MKIINRYIVSLFIIIVLTAVTFIVVKEIRKQQETRSRAASGEKASLDLPSSIAATRFQSIDVPIVFSTDGADVVGIDIVLSFNPEYLEVVDIAPLKNSVIKFFLPQDSNGVFDKQKVLSDARENNIIRFGAISYSQKSGNTEIPFFNGALSFANPLVMVRFRTLKEGTTNLNFSFQSGADESTLISSSMQNILSKVTNSTVAIGREVLITPTTIITPTSSVTPSQKPTQLAFTIELSGVGKIEGSPKRILRNLNLQIFDSSSNKISELTAENAVQYESDTKKFKGIVDVPEIATEGAYTIKVKSENFLRKLIPGIFTIIPNTLNPVFPKTFEVTLLTGDVNNDNTLNIFDYNILFFCLKDDTRDKLEFCSESAKASSDLNDDGIVDVLDLNLLLRSLSVFKGD